MNVAREQLVTTTIYKTEVWGRKKKRKKGRKWRKERDRKVREKFAPLFLNRRDVPCVAQAGALSWTMLF